MNRKKEIDWVGKWFELLNERGFATEVLLASSSPGDPNDLCHIKSYSHAEYDGVGLVLEHLRQQGHAPLVPSLPKNYHAPWWKKIIGLIRNLRFVPVFGARWKAFSSSKDSASSKNKFRFKLLSKDETQRVLKASRQAGVSVNSQLLWTLDQSLRSEWIAGSGPFYWMIPINMRGASLKTRDTSNHASWIWVDSLKANSALEIQNQIQKRFADHFHWGAWLSLNIGKVIGVSGMKFLLKKAESIQEHWVGTFSNVGAWKLNADPLVIIVPTAPSTPISAGCLTVNDQLGLSINVDPLLKVETAQIDLWLKNWVQRAMGETAL